MNLALTPVRFKQRAETEFGNKIGIVCGDVRLTYREYSRRANQLSNALTRLGVARGERVAWLGYNCHRLLEAYYGVVQMGAVLLPLNIRITASEIAFILQDSESVVLFYDGDFRPIVDAIRKESSTIKRYVALEPEVGIACYDDLLAQESPEFTLAETGDDDLAELFYTSGTTANPK